LLVRPIAGLFVSAAGATLNLGSAHFFASIFDHRTRVVDRHQLWVARVLGLTPVGPALRRMFARLRAPVTFHQKVLVQLHGLRGATDQEALGCPPPLIQHYRHLILREPLYGVFADELSAGRLAPAANEVEVALHLVPHPVNSKGQAFVEWRGRFRGDEEQNARAAFEVRRVEGFARPEHAGREVRRDGARPQPRQLLPLSAATEIDVEPLEPNGFP
jgi:hypothetical protein